MHGMGAMRVNHQQLGKRHFQACGQYYAAHFS
jgi:hypothetical protein